MDQKDLDMQEWIQTLWEYHYWGHHKLWSCVLSISEDDFRRPVSYSMGSVHQQVVHTMWAEALWLSRIQGTPRPEHSIETLPTRDLIRQTWDVVESNWRVYLASLTEVDLKTATFSYIRYNGDTVTSKLGEILGHIVNHGTDHRAQILRLIHDYGGETFEQDLFFFYLDRDAENQS